jgi:hypothetical protein
MIRKALQKEADFVVGVLISTGIIIGFVFTKESLKAWEYMSLAGIFLYGLLIAWALRRSINWRKFILAIFIFQILMLIPCGYHVIYNYEFSLSSRPSSIDVISASIVFLFGISAFQIGTGLLVAILGVWVER